MNEVYKALVKLVEENIPAVLAIVVDAKGSTPAKVSSKMLITEDGRTAGTIGGGSLEYKIIEISKEIIKTSKAKMLNFSLDESMGYQCGGSVTIYLEPINVAPRVIIFGAGHIGVALCKILRLLNLRLVVVDDRKEYIDNNDFKDVNKVYVPQLTDAFSKLEIDENSFIVIATRDHQLDLQLCKYAVNTNAKYIGVIGSKKKSEYILNSLKENGYKEDILKKVYSPVGIPIKTDTPEEIAISIAAQIIDLTKNK
ncbi:MAG: xanthine dehydrogenase accessory protein XdhC [Deferribacterota bacterium]|nr:xanthine dehydrogenase accessory protein XdhC [Deferribacterota bacterium]